MNKVTVDSRKRNNKVTEDGVIINKGNRPQDVVFASNVINTLLLDLNFKLEEIDGTWVATKKEKFDGKS